MIIKTSMSCRHLKGKYKEKFEVIKITDFSNLILIILIKYVLCK